MGSSLQYRDLRIRCVRFVSMIIKLLDSIEKRNVKFALASQVIRSSSSIGANYVEGSGGVSKRDWLNYMNIARKSALETEYWLDVLRESCPKIDNKLLDKIALECEELIKIFTSITKTDYERYGKNKK